MKKDSDPNVICTTLYLKGVVDSVRTVTCQIQSFLPSAPILSPPSRSSNSRVAAAPMLTAADLESDEWELVNDDGFVYKRKKRRLDPSAIARPADPPPDPELEARQRGARKRAALLKVRHKYQKEIALWEHLSSTLSAMERSAREKKWDERYAGETLAQEKSRPVDGGFHGVSLLDELLSQVEGQVTLIHHITSLCDVAEALCDAEEENVKKSVRDLPVWGSPVELMASLCED